MPECATPKYASAMGFERITRHPTIMAGVPCITGTRLPVATVVAYVAEGQSPAETLREKEIPLSTSA